MFDFFKKKKTNYGKIIAKGTHFMQMHNGEINPTEVVATLINQKDNIIDGIKYAEERIDEFFLGILAFIN